MKRLAPLTALLLAACSGSSDEDKAPAPTALVSLARVEQGAVSRRVTLYGLVEGGGASKRVLTAPAAAIVARIVAPVGTRVGRGQNQPAAVYAGISPPRFPAMSDSTDRRERLLAETLQGDWATGPAAARRTNCEATNSRK